MDLNENILTFGKYKNKNLNEMLRDRNYCKWFLDQNEFKIKYEYIYNKVKEYDPKIYFLPLKELLTSESFIENYTYFHLTPIEKLALNLTDNEKKCYLFYLTIINELKQKIVERIENLMENPYDIKAPVKWLQKFENDTSLKRDEFKEFINAYELPNIPYIIEDIKKEGGLIYNGANSFNIAKQRSLEQEKFWEELLKKKYGEDIGVQYQYENCIFDFINIPLNILFECKLKISDFNEEQYKKYLLTLNKYKILYLFDKDCILDINRKIIYTLNKDKYLLVQSSIHINKNKKHNKFYEMILNFTIESINDLSPYI